MTQSGNSAIAYKASEIPESQDELPRIPPCFSAPASESTICKNSYTAKEDLEDVVSNYDTPPVRHGVLYNPFD